MEKVSKIIVIFGVIFLVCNIIGYIFHIPELVFVMNNPTGDGGRSTSNIPIIIIAIITIIIIVIDIYRNK